MKPFFHKPLWRGLSLALAALLLLGALACTPRVVPPADTTAESTSALTTEASTTSEPAAGEVFTLPEPGTTSEPETDPVPPLVAPDESATQALLITAYYAAGRTDALAAASFVEIHNPTAAPIPLRGMALYLSNNGGPFAEFRFSPEDAIPAEGYFLVRGQEAATHRDILTVEHYDRRFRALAPDPENTRIALAPAGRDLPADQPLAAVPGLSDYVSAHPLDAADYYHAAGNPSQSKLVRRKATTDAVDYQTVNLERASTAVLTAIRPRCSGGDLNTEVHTAMDEVAFSHTGGVYREGFDLTLTAPEGYTVYYVINGTDPRATTPIRYTAPIHIRDTSAMTWGSLTALSSQYMGVVYAPLAATFPGAAVIKAYAVRDADGAVTPLVTHTYFVGEIFESWGVDLVSVTMKSDLFLGRKGIYNNIQQGAGAVRDRIPAHVEFVSPEGTRVHSGWSEIAMNGRGSLGMTQKSFRIMLKSHVDGAPDIGENLSTMNYDLFGKYASRTPDGRPVTWFRRILLRNGGGDMSGSPISRSHIGDAYIQRLDRHLAPDIMAYAPMMVFINGEFWGLYNARERLDAKYFSYKYAIPEEDVSVVECPYPLFYGWNVDYTAGLEDPAEIAEATYFMDLVRFCQQNDLAIEENYRYIADRIDLDGLMDFYCAQIYLGCSDWPSNNIKIWRNKNPDHPTMDTRWHFTIVDTDHGVGLNSQVDTNLWGVISDGPVISRIINHLMGNPAFRERFLMRYIWCMEVYFTPDRMVAELDDLVEIITPLMPYQLDRWRCQNGGRTDMDTWNHYLQVIRDYAHGRPPHAKAQFMQWARLDEGTYQALKVKALAEWGMDLE